MADRFLSIAQVAEKLGIDRSHMYALIRQGRFPVPVVKALGSMKVSERELERWMVDAGQVVGPPAPQVSPPRQRRRRQPPVARVETELRMPVPWEPSAR
jgi:excisionase family DNA binding protein